VLTLCELRRASRLLDATLRGQRVQAIAQPDATSVVLTTYGAPAEGASARRQFLLLACRRTSARVALLESGRESLPSPPAFAQRLRALLASSRIVGVRLLDEDRQLGLDLEAPGAAYELRLQILPHRSNLYLLDAERRVLAALRPLAETRPELALGEPWRAPGSRAPSEGEDRFAGEPDERFLFAIEAHYAGVEHESDLAERRRTLEQALRREEKGLARKLEKVDEELARAHAATGLERDGELLKGMLKRVGRGAASVVARDPVTDDEIVIALDPALSPAENLEQIFRRYRKAVRALAQGGARREAIVAALETVRVCGARAIEARRDAAGRLAAFAARDDVRPLVAKRAAVAPQRRERPDAERELAGRRFPARLAPRRYRTAGDLEIWVGRSDAGNDFLTTKLARGRDLFFHLDGAPGSHVILRSEGRSDPPSEAVLDACELAVHFETARRHARRRPRRTNRKRAQAARSKPGCHGARRQDRAPHARLARVLADRWRTDAGLRAGISRRSRPGPPVRGFRRSARSPVRGVARRCVLLHDGGNASPRG
jgi:predicted ribosome quality control (RQC) complex YloA/Tae2 family protein